jgi:hypothetical protein
MKKIYFAVGLVISLVVLLGVLYLAAYVNLCLRGMFQ